MERFTLFSTPVAAFDIEGTERLNGELAERLTAESLATPGVRRSNVGGWHSPPDLSQRPEGCYRAVVEMIVDHVALWMRELYGDAGVPVPPLRYGAHAWAMVMKGGDYTMLHEHAESHWSSAYYVDAGDADEAVHPDSGLLALVDPRRGAEALPGLDAGRSTFLVRPRTGKLVLFPGWLQHYVNPYRGSRPRIAISCNVTLHAR